MIEADRIRRAVVHRLEARRWVLDVARSTTTAKKTRRALERVRVGRLVRAEGGPDAALQRIVDEALAGRDAEAGDSA